MDIYVSKTGSDDNNGSKSSPFLTIAKARDTATENPSNIYIDSGQYEIYNFQQLSKSNIKIVYNGKDDGTTSFIVTHTTSSGSGENFMYDMGCNKITFIPSDDWKSQIYCIAYFYSRDTFHVEFYNCIFTRSNDGYPSDVCFHAWGSGSYYSNKDFYNCSFVNTPLLMSNCGSVKLINCAYLKGMNLSYASATDCFITEQFNDRYKIIDGNNETYGVYSGEYAWVDAKFLIYYNDNYYSILNDYYNADKKTYNPLTVTSKDELISAMFTIDKLLDTVTINDESFRPIDKFNTIKLVMDIKRNLKITGIIEKNEMIVGKSSFIASIANNIDYFKMDGTTSSGIRMAFSIDDGATWKTYNSGTNSFEDISVAISSSNYSDFSESDIANWNSAKATILEKGISPIQLQTIDFNTLESTKIKFAYVLSASDDLSSVDSMKNLIWQFDAKGTMDLCTDSDVSISIGSSGVSIKSLIDTDIMKTNIIYEEDGNDGLDGNNYTDKEIIETVNSALS